jgi:hypothetical protein
MKDINAIWNEKTIKYLDGFDMCNATCDCTDNCEGYDHNKPCKKIEEYNEMKNIAIAALEKQIAQKVIEKHVDGRFFCPICDIYLEKAQYCSKCGQKLDWEQK